MRVLRAMQLNKPGKFHFHMFLCLSYVFYVYSGRMFVSDIYWFLNSYLCTYSNRL